MERKQSHNKTIPIITNRKLFTIKEAQKWLDDKLGKGSRAWLYSQIKMNGIELKKNGKTSYLYETDLLKISSVKTLTEIAL